jgi:uncharacterized protein YyaL (SSP411 family)
MEKESFENDHIAASMNKYFVNIKVDREERPDIDNIYMNFVQLTTGSGGWPMTVFLLPDKRPFFGGTYFPPEDRYGRPGFPRVLNIIHGAYQNKREEVVRSADSMLGSLKLFQQLQPNETLITENVFRRACDNLKISYDSEYGGFGSAPKFPSAMVLTFLLDYYCYSNDSSALEIVENTVRKMSDGGLYDHIGGGFHRYSTDAKWLIPHFEKMLYDNALLVELLSKLFMVTSNDFYKSKVEETLEFILREMQDKNGGYYSTQDADSEGEEGGYYLWDKRELDSILNKDESEIFNNFFQVTEKGNFEGKNILHVGLDLRGYSTLTEKSFNEVQEIIKQCKRKLFTERNKRVKPLTDDKILTDWNGLMITAFCYGFRISANLKYLNAAVKSAGFILRNLWLNDELMHSYRNGQSKINGLLEDYTNLSLALIDLYEVTSESKYLHQALALSKIIVKRFYDQTEKIFYQTEDNSSDLIFRVKDFYDNATPSGNSTAAILFYKLGKIFDKEDYLQISYELNKLFAETVQRLPIAHGRLLRAFIMHWQSSREIVLFKGANKNKFDEIKNLILKSYNPNTILVYADELLKDDLTYLKDKKRIKNKTTVYVCEDFTCKSPVTVFEDLQKVLLPSEN